MSKQYRLGLIGGRTLRDDLHRWWDRIRGRPAPRSGLEREMRRGDHIWALREVHLEVRQGEIVGIIGRNGAGKSTLLKILSRITAPTSGIVRMRGRVGSLLEVGTGFHPELTGRENTFLNGAILGMTRREIQERYDAIVDFSGVEPFIDTPVKRYSSGMRVRLAFAVAAHLDPEILLVDEVLAVGDAAFQKRCIGKMSEVAKAGRTVVFVSHDMSAVSALCERAIVLDEGRVMAQGDTESAIETYLSRFGGGIGSNFGEVRLSSGGARGEGPFELHAIRTLDASGRVRGDFRSAETIVVEFDFTRFERLDYLRIGFDLVSTRDTVVFRTFHNDVEEFLTAIPAEGVERLQAIIPPGILNGGLYRIQPRIGVHRRGSDWLVGEVSGPSISVRLGIPNVDYAESNRPGLVAPTIEWKFP
ncbi:MAG TPA: polysaccharide ABC transporter ATP-binding protein [Gemmatimonadota bacterium]|nr:polysaccharide ABC transporter ATP-binding protein [Gemmatimonadota bacterium]